MCFKLLVSFWVIFIPYVAAAQSFDDSAMYLKNSPLKNSHTFFRTHKGLGCGLGDNYQGIYIYSDSGSVYSLSNGVVAYRIPLDSNFLLIIVQSHDTFFSYSGIQDFNLKKGDTIYKQMKIGTIEKELDLPYYEMRFEIDLLDEKGKLKEIEPGKLLGYKTKGK